MEINLENQFKNYILKGYLSIPEIDTTNIKNGPSLPSRLIIFVHGSGSSKDSPRNLKIEGFS